MIRSPARPENRTTTVGRRTWEEFLAQRLS
jgi:hypothetical protein